MQQINVKLADAEAALAAAQDQLSAQQAGVTSAEAAVEKAERARAALIRRAVDGDAAATSSEVRTADDAVRDAAIDLEIARLKLAAGTNAVEEAKRLVLRAKAAFLTAELQAAVAAEATALGALMNALEQADAALSEFHARASARERAYLSCQAHNAAVDRLAKPSRSTAAPEQRPVTVTVLGGSVISMSRGPSGEPIAVPAEPTAALDDHDELQCRLEGPSASVYFGEVALAMFVQGLGWKVRPLSQVRLMQRGRHD